MVFLQIKVGRVAALKDDHSSCPSHPGTFQILAK